MKNPHKALEAIERLVGGDFGLDMEFYLVDKPKKDKHWLKRNLRIAAKIIGEVYVIAHAEGDCKGHPSWEERKYKILAKPEL